MKISCQSCQAKYTIADEKVLGKIVKIRCKKCGATIVINGNEGGRPDIHEHVRGRGASVRLRGRSRWRRAVDGQRRATATSGR